MNFFDSITQNPFFKMTKKQKLKSDFLCALAALIGFSWILLVIMGMLAVPAIPFAIIIAVGIAFLNRRTIGS